MTARNRWADPSDPENPRHRRKACRGLSALVAGVLCIASLSCISRKKSKFMRYPHEAFLSSWVSQEYDNALPFAEPGESPEERVPLRAHASRSAYLIREERGEKIAEEIAQEMAMDVWLTGWEEQKERMLFVLARLGTATSACVLSRIALFGRGKWRDLAIDSLRFFGNAPAADRFTFADGSCEEIVFRPRPSKLATRTLLDLLRHAFYGKSPRSGAARDQAERLVHLILKSLCTHRRVWNSKVVLLEVGGSSWVSDAVIRQAGEVIVRNLGLIDFRQLLDRLEDRRPNVRRIVAYALGWSCRRDAIEPLFRALGDPVEGVRVEANNALLRLSGEQGPGSGKEGESRRYGLSEWQRILGEHGERFDARKAARYVDPAPGIHEHQR